MLTVDMYRRVLSANISYNYRMSIEFEADYRGGPPKAFMEKPATGIAGWLVRNGIAKTVALAKMMMLGVVLFNVILSAIIIALFL